MNNMSKKYLDSSLLDRAIVFACEAHRNVERKGKGFPYIIHPLEAMSIVSTITSDQELLAAACLHDVIEDTEYTYEDIKERFGERVADLVNAETDQVFPNMSSSESWHLRKEAAIKHLAEASRDVQIVAIGDKLSNMRAIYRDYKVDGESFFNRFHVKDPKEHAWRYRSLAESFNKIRDTEAYQEFVHLINKVFPKYEDFSVKKEGIALFFKGQVNKENVLRVKEYLDKEHKFIFDFKDVSVVTFSGLRGLIILLDEGYHFVIRETSKEVAARFDECGLSTRISILRSANYYEIGDSEKSGDGYTADSYFTKDGETMFKLYYPFVDPKEVEREKRYSKEAMLLGIPTPLSGGMIKVGDKNGVLFERIHEKVSYARALSNNHEKNDELAKEFAELAKKLHTTKCNKDVFPDAKETYIEYIKAFKDISEEERNKLIKFVQNIEDRETCLHGDFHMGNAIFTPQGQKLFIDMGDFSYGHPYFDLGTMYFLCHSSNEDTTMRVFHCTSAQVKEFYNNFIKYYFGEGADIEKINNDIKHFAAMTIIHFASKTQQKPFMAHTVRELLLKDL